MSIGGEDVATELLIAQLIEADLHTMRQTADLERAQLEQTLADSARAAGRIPKRVRAADVATGDIGLALAMMAADARVNGDAAVAQALQHSDDATSVASRQRAQQILAEEKKLALDAEFARRLQAMEDDGEMDIDDDGDGLDAEGVLGLAEIDAIMAANPNEKGKGKGAAHEAFQSRGIVKLEPEEMKIEDDFIGVPPGSTYPLCGICLEPFILVHSPNNASTMQKASASSKLPFGVALPCSQAHGYCHDCLRTYVCGKVDPEGNGRGNPNAVVFPIRCPECRSTDWPDGIQDDLAVRVLSENDMLLWYQQKLLDTVPRLYCPNARCSVLVQIHEDPDEAQALCPACNTSICVPCRVLWHVGLNCEEYQALPLDERSPEDQQALQLMRAQNWRRCPNCAVIVELIMGCNHITCRCGAHFCFKCGSKWDSANGRCTRVPQCDLWDEDMLLEERERERQRAGAPAAAGRVPQRPVEVARLGGAPLALDWGNLIDVDAMIEGWDVEESDNEEPQAPLYRRPAFNDRDGLRWMDEPDILCTRHWFTASMISDLTCRYCETRLNSIADLRYHLAHTRQHPVYACCGRFFKRQEDFDRHIAAVPRRFGRHVHQVDG